MLDTGVRSEIAAWELKYDDLGRVVRRTYLNQKRLPNFRRQWDLCPGVHLHSGGQSGKPYVISDIGGRPCPTKRGVAGKQYEYDAQGNRIQTTWIGTAGTPVLNEDGYAIGKRKYDADGKSRRSDVLRRRRQALPDQGRLCRSDVHL